LRLISQKCSAKYRFKCPETSVDVHIITAGAHQANTPLLSGKLTETRADLKIELIEETASHGGIVHALGN
jgi:hypothetical protein